MTKHIKFETENLDHIAVLSITSWKENYNRKRETEKVSERFLHSALLLPEGEILGVQISAKKDGAIIFSSPGIKATVEDFNWIFKSYGEAEIGRLTKIRDLYKGGRYICSRLYREVGGEPVQLGRRKVF